MRLNNLKNLLHLVVLFSGLTAGAQVLTSSDLPLIIINTNGQEIPDEPKIPADMGIVYNGPGVRNFPAGPFNGYNGKIGIELRGQSTQMFPMKAYGIELRDAAGNSQNKSILGLPSESDWILYAPYNEKTLMHNFLAYTFAREMGRWASNCRYVEVILNGDYRGIYILEEKIKRGSGRVNISKLNASDISGDAVTGGYIFSIDKEADAWYSQYPPMISTQQQKIQFAYVYPKVTSIVPEQAAYLKSYVDSFENAMYGPDFRDPVKGWRHFADEGSFVDYFIINEISRNVDGYRLSTYLYKDKQSKGGKIFAGPVWDYDLSFRNANYCNGADTTGWAWKFNWTCPQDYWQVPFWWNRLEEDSAFQASIRCRWIKLRQTSLSDTRINTLIDSIVGVTAEARQRHFQRWPVMGQYVWPNVSPIPQSYGEEISVLKDWLHKRITWITNNIPNHGACYEFPSGEKSTVLIHAVPNPVHDQVVLDIRSKQNQQLHMEVYAMDGKIVFTKSLTLTAGNIFMPVNTSVWARGVYLLRFYSDSDSKGVIRLLRQ